MKFILPMTMLMSLAINGYAAEDILVADFEGTDYGAWKSEGKAFGAAHAKGTLPGQMNVEGFQGKGLANSFVGGDDSTGQLTSPTFKIQRKFVTFLIGGGGWADETCMNLIVDDKVVRTATGPNTVSGGSERLEPLAWDVSDLIHRDASLVIVDSRKGGWGHINVDHIIQTDNRGTTAIATPPTPLQKDVLRQVLIKNKYLHFPMKIGAKARVVTVNTDGKQIHRFDMELADGQPDWWAPLDVSSLIGKEINLSVNVLPIDSKAIDSILQSDELPKLESLYLEPLRSQFHFSPKRGWMNDPNGLVFYRGEYHLFFQHNPYGRNWGNMHWGHATSPDLVHWTEHGDVLAPDDMGPMFSGSAVVDWDNTSGFGSSTQPPLVLIYTAAGNPTTQCIAYSNDGRSFNKYEKNPVIKQISGGNRDPKVFWHKPTKQWVQVLYVELLGKKHTVHFFTSANLRDWELASVFEGGVAGDKYLYECPDFFELPLDGDSSKSRWILTAANSEYAIGTFDGKAFHSELGKIGDVRGKGFYAAQTFSDMPDGRRIQIGWMQAPSPGMSFNQLQSIPCELTLRTTPDGPRLHRSPVQELVSLRNGGNRADSLDSFRSELIELRAEFEPGIAESLAFRIRGANCVYNFNKQELEVNGVRAAAPLIAGKQNIVIYADKTMLEVFASDGQTYMPLPFIAKPEDQSVVIDPLGGKATMKSIEVYDLKSIWKSR